MYAKLPTDRAVSIMQALDLAEDGTFLCRVPVLVMNVAHLMCKLSERSKVAAGVYAGQLGFVWRAELVCEELFCCNDLLESVSVSPTIKTEKYN